MGIDNNNTIDEEALEEGGEQDFDFWSDEGARRFNEMLDEGSAYASGADLSENFEDEECEYLDSEIYDPDEETLPPGEMEMIFENCFIM